MQQFDDRVAVITGAASGIGLAIARHAAELGMHLVLADIDELALVEAAKSLNLKSERRLLCRQVDVSKAASVQALADAAFDSCGQVDLLFNNAGVGGGGNVWELDEDYWQWVLGANLWGVIHGIRSFTSRMMAQGSGHIINTASVAGLMSAPGTAPYTVSKHAVVALSEVLLGDLKNAGSALGVSVLCPSFVDTKIYAAARNRPLPETLRNDPDYQREQRDMEALAAAFFETAQSPAAVAEQLFDAIRQRQFYVLTHAQGSREQLAQRMDDILKGREPGSAGPVAFPMA